MSNHKSIEEITKILSEHLKIPEHEINQVLQNNDITNLKFEDSEYLLSKLDEDKNRILIDLLKTIG